MTKAEKVGKLRRILMSEDFHRFSKGAMLDWITGAWDGSMAEQNARIDKLIAEVFKDVIEDAKPEIAMMNARELEAEFTELENAIVNSQRPMKDRDEATHKFRLAGVGTIYANLADESVLPLIEFDPRFAMELLKKMPDNELRRYGMTGVRDRIEYIWRGLDWRTNSLPRKLEEIKELGYNSIALGNFVHESCHMFLARELDYSENSVLWRSTLKEEFAASGDWFARRNLTQAVAEERMVLGFQVYVNEVEGDDDQTAKDAGFNLHTATAAENYAIEELEKMGRNVEHLAYDFKRGKNQWFQKTAEDFWSLTAMESMEEFVGSKK